MTSVSYMLQDACLDTVNIRQKLRHTISIKALQVWLLHRHTSPQNQLHCRSQQLQGLRGSCTAGADDLKYSLHNLQHTAEQGVEPCSEAAAHAVPSVIASMTCSPEQRQGGCWQLNLKQLHSLS